MNTFDPKTQERLRLAELGWYIDNHTLVSMEDGWIKIPIDDVFRATVDAFCFVLKDVYQCKCCDSTECPMFDARLVVWDDTLRVTRENLDKHPAFVRDGDEGQIFAAVDAVADLGWRTSFSYEINYTDEYQDVFAYILRFMQPGIAPYCELPPVEERRRSDEIMARMDPAYIMRVPLW